MPRRPRRDADESAVTDGASSGDSQAAVEHVSNPSSSGEPLADSQAAQSQSDANSPTSARRPRRKKAGTETAPPDAVETPQPSAAPAPSGRTRRRVRAVPDDAPAAVEAAPAIDSPGTAHETPQAPRPRRRGIGGRRTATEASAAVAPPDLGSGEPSTQTGSIPGLDQTEESASPHAEDAPAPSRSRRSRRGGRNRRGRDQGQETPTGEVVDTLPDTEIETPEAVETEPAPEAAAEDAPKARRPRRGGRRRPAGSGDDAEGAPDGPESASRKSELGELTLPVPFIREHWTAPSVVASIEDRGLSPIEMGVEAKCDPHTPSISINGRSYPAHFFFANADAARADGDVEIVARQIRRAASAGIHLHTCVVYLPLKNAYGERAFGPIDDSIRTIMDADPDGYIVLRIQCVPTNFWARTHPDQMVKYHNGSEGDVSIASREFWNDCVDAIGALLARLAEPEAIGYGRVFALHLDKGEWFYEPGSGFDYSSPNRAGFRDWLHEHYQSAYALQAAWYDGKVTFDMADVPTFEGGREKRSDVVLNDRNRDRRHVDYVTYASSIVGSAIAGLAAAIKKLTNGKLLVIVPYGYLFEFATRNHSGHQALGSVVRCPDIDALTGPNSYLSRAAGGVGGFAAPVDSIILHDKLWIVEDDTKTFLATEGTPDSYNPRIPGQQETIMVQRRNFFAALAHGCGLSWMDLWGQGWLDSDDIWDEIAAMLGTARRLHEADGPIWGAPEAAVLIDEASFSWVRDDAGGQQLQSGMIVKARDLLLRSGASVGFYLQSDVDILPESVKVVFFLNALQVTTDERQAIREKLQRPGITLVWLYAPGLFDENGIAPAEVAEIVGMPLKAQPWNSRIGTIFTDERNVIIERLHGGKRMGTEDIVNPSFMCIDPQAAVLGEYAQTGNVSIAVKEVEGGWKSIFVGEPHLTGELIRGILRSGGVHLYDVQDDIVYARGDGVILIHAPYTGQRILHLSRPMACYSVFDDRLITQNSSTARVFMRGRSTHMIICGEMDMIARRTGISVAELLASLSKRPEREPRDQERDSDGDGQDTGGEEVDGGGNRADESRSAGEDIESEDSGQAIVLDARQEASRITQAVLMDIEFEPGVEENGLSAVGIDELVIYDNEAASSTEPAAPAASDDSDAAQNRPSSRRRRWRRRRSGNNPESSGSAQSISVDQILGDLRPRRNNPGEEGTPG